jgi:hypothetical protein
MKARADYASAVGKVYSSWTVLALTRHDGKARFDARCRCGVTYSVSAPSILSGRSTRCRPCAVPICGPQNGHRATVGHKTTPEWNSWRGMIERCTNPNHKGWKRYGGRGITVCDRWRESFAAFLADMGAKPGRRYSIERKDNNKATHEEQARNRSSTHLITVGDVTLCVEDWAKRSGIHACTIYDRLARGWSPEQAVQPRANAGRSTAEATP